MAQQTPHGLYQPDETDIDIWGDLLNQNFALIEMYLDEITTARGSAENLNVRFSNIEATLEAAGEGYADLTEKLRRFDTILRGPFTVYTNIPIYESAKSARKRIIHSASSGAINYSDGALTLCGESGSWIKYIDDYGLIKEFTTNSSTSSVPPNNYVFLNLGATPSFVFETIDSNNAMGYLYSSAYNDSSSLNIILGETDTSGNFYLYTFKGIYSSSWLTSNLSGSVTFDHNLGVIPRILNVTFVFENPSNSSDIIGIQAPVYLHNPAVTGINPVYAVVRSNRLSCTVEYDFSESDMLSSLIGDTIHSSLKFIKFEAVA